MAQYGLVVAVLPIVTACSFSVTPGVAGTSDALDGDVLAACMTWHPQGFDPCALGTPMGDVQLGSDGSPYTYDTSNEGGDLYDHTGAQLLHSPVTVPQGDGSVAAVLSVASLDIAAGAVWNVIGAKPLFVASWSTIQIDGDLDAGSHTTEVDATAHVQQTTQLGAGAGLACTNLAGTAGYDAATTGGSGGGGGGALQGRGGDGAVGDTGCSSSPCPRPGGPGGAASAAVPMTVRGGCPGAASGNAGGGAQVPATATTISAGGGGGGAIQLAARMSIAITGRVHAGGAGGAGAPQGSACGGGGGGSGGYLGLDAPMISVTGILAANGGGGGSSAAFASHGNAGSDGQVGSTPAAGGAFSGGTCGLAGAAGAAGATLGGTTATGNDACGGGGGGGGAGYVLVWSPAFTSAGATISPAPLAL